MAQKVYRDLNDGEGQRLRMVKTWKDLYKVFGVGEG